MPCRDPLECMTVHGYCPAAGTPPAGESIHCRLSETAASPAPPARTGAALTERERIKSHETGFYQQKIQAGVNADHGVEAFIASSVRIWHRSRREFLAIRYISGGTWI